MSMDTPKTEFELNKQQLIDSLAQLYEAIQMDDVDRAEYIMGITQLLFDRMKAEVRTNKQLK